MPASESGSLDEDAGGPRSLWQRFADLIRKPDDDRPSVGQRLTGAMLKADSGAAPKPEPTTVEELEEAVKRADDKERLIGLIAAPLAGMIGLLITSSLAASTSKGTHSTAYSVLGAVLLALAAAMLAMAWWRKRLYLGIVMALYGLSVFNLRFWGFGVPFVLVGAWYLVRAYRLNQKLKLAREAAPGATYGRCRPGVEAVHAADPASGQAEKPPGRAQGQLTAGDGPPRWGCPSCRPSRSGFDCPHPSRPSGHVLPLPPPCSRPTHVAPAAVHALVTQA